MMLDGFVSATPEAMMCTTPNGSMRMMKLVARRTFLEYVEDSGSEDTGNDGCSSAPLQMHWSRLRATTPKQGPFCHGKTFKKQGSKESIIEEQEPTSDSDLSPGSDLSPISDPAPALDPTLLDPEDDRTTLVIQNLPDEYTRMELAALLDSQGFRAQYSFLYLPVEVGSPKNFGYAFVNFELPRDAHRFMKHFQTFSEWGLPYRKAANVEWSHAQGIEEHIRRYRNSPVMHRDVPEDCKPMVFENGLRVEFPPPTKKIPAFRRLRTRKGWRPNDLVGREMQRACCE